MVGDIGASLPLLADRLEGKLETTDSILDSERRRSWGTSTSAPRRSVSPSTPQRIVHDVRQVMPEDGIVVPGQRHVQDLVRPELPDPCRQHAAARQRAGHDGRGAALGHDGGAALPDRRVMAVCGDGGFMMNSQELETAVRLGLNLVVLILDDGAYGMIRWKQAVDSFPDFGMTFGNPDFVRYAEAYGAKGSRVEATEDLVPTLEAAFNAGGVHLVGGADRLFREHPRPGRGAESQGRQEQLRDAKGSGES